MGVDIPGTLEDNTFGSDAYNHNQLMVGRLITCVEDTLLDTWHDYIDQWAEWLVYYIDRTENIRAALERMCNSFKTHPKLFPFDESSNAYRFTPSMKLCIDLEAKVYAFKTPSFRWRRIRELVAIRPHVKVFWECAAMTKEKKRIALAIDGIVDDPLR